MHPVLQGAVDEAVAAFGIEHVASSELADGSVRISVRELDIGDTWQPRTVEITVTLLVTFPATSPYPFYLPPELSHTSGPMPSNMTPVTLDGRRLTQLSVRPGGNRAVESLTALIGGVVSWLRMH
jgi:hypothetical protein